MNKPLNRHSLHVIESLARAPIDPVFKRGVAMLLQSSRSMQIEDAERVISDADVVARRNWLAEVAHLGARWTSLRDDCAAMLNRFDADASTLANMEEEARQMLQTMQDAIRLSYARQYIP